ncbi:hypothetical protein AYO44_13595, partial [Planctomycetaceae bacterium SCGC AG-212-F19]
MPIGNRPLVSVITPTFNRSAFLAETIDSVLEQDYPNLEYIVLDDGSTDGTSELLEQYAGRLRWTTHANIGETRTVNKGLTMARGEFVTIVNSDDLLLPGMVGTCVDFLTAHPDVLMAYPDWLRIDEWSRVIAHNPALDCCYEEMVRIWGCIPGPGAMLRRRALELEPGRNPTYRFVGDFEYWLRLGLHGSMKRIPLALATHRSHNDSAQVSQTAAVAQEIVALALDYFENWELPSRIRDLRAESLEWAYWRSAEMCRHDPSKNKHFGRQAAELNRQRR